MKYRSMIGALCMAAVMLAGCAQTGAGNAGNTGGTGGGNTQQPSEENPPVILPLDPSHGVADQSYLYGMCYLLEERAYYGSPFTEEDIPAEAELLKNLGAKTVRQWMHCTQLMTDKDTMNETACARMHKLLQECTSRGLTVIGMSHHNFNHGVTSVGKLKRNLIAGSEYIGWLDDYYTTWYNLVREFPEVTYWEIDNELNNPDFIYDAYTKKPFTAVEMAAVATDMLYYGTRAIHDANPKAQSVMGGLTEPMSLGNSDLEGGRPSNAWFLQAIYDNIASGEFGYFYSTETDLTASLDADDYFDVACWHPYVWNRQPLDEDFFVEENAKTYQVILDNEGKHKKVFFTEVGFTDFTRGEAVVSQSIENMFHAISTRMPYVETVNLFKMYDTADPNAWGGDPNDNGYVRYGLFYDPNPAREYCKIDEADPFKMTEEKCPSGGPKKSAYTFQRLAGGSGPLDLLVK